MSDRQLDEQRDDESAIPWLPEGMEGADLEAPSDEPEDDEGDDGDEDELLESYGLDSEAPWSPPPLAQARAWIRANGAEIDLLFPEAYSEDRSAKLKDLAVGQGLDYFTHERTATQAAQEFGFAGYVYRDEMAAIREEKRKYGDILGQGDAVAGRIAGAPEGAPAYDSAGERHDFRKQQREQQREVQTVTFQQLNSDGSVTPYRQATITTGRQEPAAAPGGYDPEGERLAHDLRVHLQARRRAEAAAADPAALDAELAQAVAEGRDFEALSPALRAEIQREGRRVAEQGPPTLTKEEVHYSFADTTHQISLGLDPECCGRCVHFRAPGTPSETGGCRIVVGPIKGTDTCDRFKRKAAAR